MHFLTCTMIMYIYATIATNSNNLMLVHNMEWFEKYFVSKREFVVVCRNYTRVLKFCAWMDR